MTINEDNRYDWIDKYLENELSPFERKEFERELVQNPALKAEVDLQVQAQENLKNILLDEHFKKSAEHILQQEADNFFQNSSLSYKNNLTKQIYLFPKYRTWAVAACLLILTACIYFFFIYNPPIEQKIVDKNETDKKENKETGEEKQTPKDSIKKIIPHLEPKETPLPLVRLDSIPELILKKTLGFSGNAEIVKTTRPILLYRNPPSKEINTFQSCYLFEDTLKLYGIKNISTLQLLYEEPRGKYHLVIQKDTFQLRYRDFIWRKIE